ncbi:MAG TPA: hypothetical protein VGK87_02490 [Anaerolineae bacterium]|jgi:hypothetical protein
MTAKAMSISFNESLEHITKLVRYFNTNRHIYQAGDFKEAQVWSNLIDPLFIALGRDVHNEQRIAPQYSPVVIQPSQDIERQKRVPDYAFRTGLAIEGYHLKDIPARLQWICSGLRGVRRTAVGGV